MEDERFPWAPEDAVSITRDHNAKLEQQANALALQMAEDEIHYCENTKTTLLFPKSFCSCGPEETDLEQARRTSGSFAQSQARLARALDLLASRVRPHLGKEQ